MDITEAIIREGLTNPLPTSERQRLVRLCLERIRRREQQDRLRVSLSSSYTGKAFLLSPPHGS